MYHFLIRIRYEKKTEMMIFDPLDISIGVDGEIIKSTMTMKVLGVLLDNQLNWEPSNLLGKYALTSLRFDISEEISP